MIQTRDTDDFQKSRKMRLLKKESCVNRLPYVLFQMLCDF